MLEPVPSAIRAAIAAVEPPDPAWAARAAERQDRLTMPPGSLGRLLELGRLLAAIQRTDRPEGHPALIAVLAADHGIAEAGVSAYPQEVTGQMVANYLAGGAAINVLARRVGAVVRVADLGVKHRPAGLADGEVFVSRPIRPGTSNMLDGPAMSVAEAYRAVGLGLELAEAWVAREAVRVVALGEMGIGNSTTAAVLIAALTGRDPLRLVGRGTGVDDLGFRRKCAAVAGACARHVRPGIGLWDLLACLGGFEILGLAGLALGAAAARALIVIDGLISAAGALVAQSLCPAVVGSMVAAHLGPEPGHAAALEALGLPPLLDLRLRLGEGTGAALALPLIASAADLLRDMATFDAAGVSGPVLSPVGQPSP
ncbi:MAG: nicotinate-nucleotide--dimethylbenzimidazole phosphoribosyltransferase [Isosphaeraceae bacterium]|nr:nicotinate-nucleotide--dimethylbenzimidazole phosphoribosyltransferase [Isosphaeraceae bacterium]